MAAELLKSINPADAIIANGIRPALNELDRVAGHEGEFSDHNQSSDQQLRGHFFAMHFLSLDLEVATTVERMGRKIVVDHVDRYDSDRRKRVIAAGYPIPEMSPNDSSSRRIQR